MSLLDKIRLGTDSIISSVLTSCRFKMKKNINCLDSESNVVVSLTTFPPRIKHVVLTLKSILNQKVKPAKVLLYLSRKQFTYESLPSELKKLERYGVEIKFVEEDLKSYKKLLYARKEFPNMNILTADDDVCYPVNWLEKIVETSKIYPNDVIFYRGHILCDENNELLTYREMLKGNTKGIKTSMSFIPTGVCGILYPPDVMHQDWDRVELATELSPTGDDIWFKVMTLLLKKKCTRVYEYNVLFPPVLGSQKISLKKINVDSSENNNDKQLKNVLEYYNLVHEGRLCI